MIRIKIGHQSRKILIFCPDKLLENKLIVQLYFIVISIVLRTLFINIKQNSGTIIKFESQIVRTPSGQRKCSFCTKLYLRDYTKPKD